jgi:heme/copper-type cytochrome/quinol oxidase subunit 2
MQAIAVLLRHGSNFAEACKGGGTITTQAASNTSAQDFNTCLPTVAADGSTARTVIQLIFGIIGAIAIIYIMYGAFRYVRSQGEPKEINQARQTIIYAVLGLIIAVSAEAFVSFALGKL